MFKKPLGELKTTAPLRSTDRRKLRQRVLQAFPSIPPEEGDALVVYLSPDGDPLWFTIGKGSEDLIPTVHTLWKRPEMLPFLSTPSAVVPKLIGGADLMIPGVVQSPTALAPDQLVAVTQYHRGAIGPPLAVGRMAVSSDTLRSADEQDLRGKAVYVWHTWKDALWEMGPSKKLTPLHLEHLLRTEDEPSDGSDEAISIRELTPQDVSDYLHAALLHTIGVTFARAPIMTFPMPATTFWSSYVLPARPAYALEIHGLSDASSLDVKHSTHKNAKSFLKAAAKEGLIKVKDVKGDIVVTGESCIELHTQLSKGSRPGVHPEHQAVLSRHSFRTLGDLEAKSKRVEELEQKAKAEEEKRKSEIRIRRLWQPVQNTVPLFVAAKKETSEMYSIADIETIVNEYIATKRLVNPNDQQYINVGLETAFALAVAKKGENELEFVKRDDVLKRVCANMQAWHEIGGDDRKTVRGKGEIQPIAVAVKARNGRKTCTFITGYEPFGLETDDLADGLRKACASSTSLSPVERKTWIQIMVQGSQTKAVVQFLSARGVPEQWIKCSGEKKKKGKK
ncbi:eukaryotic translation initiation factor SUI1 family protein [Epithele typhae]|uniref:eukaryotic translation initiation factor SUI1 family protein n=1 Tax=Epithele typhae TaxID=378194 RepID=UPI002007CB35|nr:eukaryotic translation initiation factor SUI1 family protein [Epithele typhae]KAH9916268.1 eukaryotic translation initiation factor SUI1 family protein [Epithele typhae]